MSVGTQVVKIVNSFTELDWHYPYKNTNTGESVGTGFFIDDRGTIVTCAHVVENAVKIHFTVPAESKDKKEAVLVSICYDKDIAILRPVDYKNSSYMVLGDSDSVKQGDNVTAIGYPLAQDRLKMSAGIVSGRQDRHIQTDTPINGGNSGGPLLDDNERVIGINSSKMASWMADNIGYAIPIYDFQVMQERMMQPRKPIIIRRPRLIADFNNSGKHLIEFMKKDGVGCDTGYYARRVYEQSPLYHIGMRSGDILCSFDDQKVDNYGDISVDWSVDRVHMFDILNRYDIGTRVNVSYWSHENHSIITKEIMLDDTFPFKIKKLYIPFDTPTYEIIGGIVITPLSFNYINDSFNNGSSSGQVLKLKDFTETKNMFKPRLVIASIMEGSEVNTYDVLKWGEVIERVNGQEVYTLQELCHVIHHHSIQSGDDKHIKIVTREDRTVILSMRELVREEEFLTKQYKFDSTDAMEIIRKMVSSPSRDQTGTNYPSALTKSPTAHSRWRIGSD